MAVPLIKLTDVSLGFQIRHGFFRHTYKRVLASVNLDIRRGETLGIIGRNGCGKTTLLRLLAGVFLPDSGTIIRGDTTVSLLTVTVGFDAELSGRDNILLSAMLLGASRTEAERNVERIIEFSELGDAIEEPVRVYSTGMQMRLGFSVAITMKPDVLLIDETLSSGDAAFRPKAEAAITSKIRSEQTVVLVSHSHAQICDLCDRVIWLESGSVKMEGHPHEVVDIFEDYIKRNRMPLEPL